MGNGNMKQTEQDLLNQNLQNQQRQQRPQAQNIMNQTQPPMIQRQMIIVNGRPHQIQYIIQPGSNNNQRFMLNQPLLMIRSPNQQFPFLMIRGNGMPNFPFVFNNIGNTNNNNNNNNNIPRRRNEDGVLEPQVGNKKMNMKQIERLGIEIYDKSKHYSTAKCMICLDNFEDKAELRRLDCLHIFHKDCIDGWLKEHGNCPIDKILVDI